MARGVTAACVACRKKFKKDGFSVQCTICGLWIHGQCAGMTGDLFSFLDEPHKQTGTAHWARRSWTSYAQGMNNRMREIGNNIKEVKQSYTKNE
jgi:hypothetical protein